LGVINTGDGNDRITGKATGTARSDLLGIYTTYTIDTGNGNDIITGIGTRIGIQNYSIINTGNGDDSIIAEAGFDPLLFGYTSISNIGTINTGNGNDSIISKGRLGNRGLVFLGEGNESIIADADLPNPALENFNAIETGDGDDTITSTRVIYNQGVINAGNGEDSIIADGGYDGTGSVFLGNGKDYLKGFGSGNFNGENGKDTLELTSGSYTVGRSGTAVNFTKDSIIMNTSECEKLIAGGTTYNFSSLTNGQTIFVA
jgi:hypothetical protein